MEHLSRFKNAFRTDVSKKTHLSGGLFGYTAYQSVMFFESIQLKQVSVDIPEMFYSLFRYVIAIDHFTNTMHIYGHFTGDGGKSAMDEFISIVRYGGFLLTHLKCHLMNPRIFLIRSSLKWYKNV